VDPNGPILTIVANPGGPGRTGVAAAAVGALLAGAASGPAHDPVAVGTVDLAADAAGLLGWGSPLAATHRASIAGARALVVASPTYKATYTGLLKVFVDQIDAGELDGIPTVAVMTGGSAHHALAVDVHLAPLLVEVGASLPARGLYLAGPDVDEPDAAIDRWWSRAGAPLRRALRP
jgi:FMN reductase